MKEYTIGKLFNLAKYILDDDNIERRKHHKTTIAIRHMLKVNSDELARVGKIIDSEINDIVNDTLTEFCDEDKADDSRVVKEAYRGEYDVVVQDRLNELSVQKMPASFIYITSDDADKYFKINDGELTESEMDIIEEFINEEEELMNATPEQ